MPDKSVIEVESLAYGGRGVARLASSKTVFVAGAVPGDRVRIAVEQDHDNYLEAKVAELVAASSCRREPACEYHASCGGCPMQHIDAEALRDFKRQFVVDALERIGRVAEADSYVALPVHAGEDWHYRNKLEFQPVFDKGRGGKLGLGFSAEGTDAVVAVDKCLLLAEKMQKLPAKIAGALGFARAFGDEFQELRRVSLRIATNRKDIELALWTSPGYCDRNFLARVLGDTLNTSSLVRVLVKGELKKRDIRGVEALSGKGFWQERLAGLNFKVSAPSFFQTNTRVAELMVAEVLSITAGHQQVIDLYSGVGSFTLPLADLGHEVIAIESAGSSVRDLRRNLQDNQLEAEVMGGAVEYLLPELGRSECLVVDPPRSGLSEKARAAIIASAPRTLVYVSCNPTTLARDIRALAAAGYELQKVTPFDMFPQSYHVECVATLMRA